jgi:hypothetical protein
MEERRPPGEVPFAPAAQRDADDLVHAELVVKYKRAMAEIEMLKARVAELEAATVVVKLAQ